ncbi:MAG: hypothetical protein WAO28_01935 [Candidatus Microsaccharimonas sp.]
MGKLNDSIELVKTGLEVKIALATAEEKEKLANAKIALADLKSDIADLKEENTELKAMLAKKDSFLTDRGVIRKHSDGEMDQPYCPVCFAKVREIPLQKLWEGRAKNQSLWVCPEKTCGATYNPWDHKEPDTPSVFTEW